jgi:hypothetical protein
MASANKCMVGIDIGLGWKASGRRAEATCSAEYRDYHGLDRPYNFNGLWNERKGAPYPEDFLIHGFCISS